MSLGPETTIYRFGHELNAWCHSSARAKQTSALYDLPGRSQLGFSLVYAAVPGLLRQIDAAIGRRELGASLRAPLLRPTTLQMLIVIEGWLMGRERLIIDNGERLPEAVDRERDRADWELVGSWYSEVVGALRGDGEPFPLDGAGPDGRVGAGETIDDQPLLDDAAWQQLVAGAAPLSAAEEARAQRAFGALDLFALTLHGEQRDGLFDRGPWRLADGFAIVLHEVNDLENDVLPWAGEESRLGVDAVGVLRAFRPEVELRVDMWGTTRARPSGQPDRLHGLWARRGAELRPLPLEELEQIAARATAATAALYERMAGWDDDYRTAYGAPLFVNHLVPIARAAGIEGSERELLALAEEVTAAELAGLRGQAEAHPVWGRLARTDTDVVYTSPERP